MALSTRIDVQSAPFVITPGAPRWRTSLVQVLALALVQVLVQILVSAVALALVVALVQALAVVQAVEPHPRSILRPGPCTVRQK